MADSLLLLLLLLPLLLLTTSTPATAILKIMNDDDDENGRINLLSVPCVVGNQKESSQKKRCGVHVCEVCAVCT
jgi:hypothetical protein